MSRFPPSIRRIACRLNVSHLPHPALLHLAAPSHTFGAHRSAVSFSYGPRQCTLHETAQLSFSKHLSLRSRQSVRTYWDSGSIGEMDFGDTSYGSEYSDGGEYPGNDGQQEFAPDTQEASGLPATEAGSPADQLGEEANDGKGLGDRSISPMTGTHGGGGVCPIYYGTAGGSRSSDVARRRGGRGSKDSGHDREEGTFMEFVGFVILFGVPVFAMGYAWGKRKGRSEGRE